MWLLAASVAVCPRLAFVGGEVALTEAEKRLACGDERSEAWREVPSAQAVGFLRAFLQNRGYHEPGFSIGESSVTVTPGPRSEVKLFTARGQPPGLDPGKSRNVVGQVLTPRLLDEAKASLLRELQYRGYACPDVSVTAEPRSGHVQAVVSPGEKLIVSQVADPVLPGIAQGVFRRFEAFNRGKPLDSRLMTVTSERIVREALFMSAYYEVECGTGPPRISLQVVPAPPRLVRVGVGVDSEGYARFRGQWKHALIGKRASSVESTLQGSYREQSSDTLARFYLSPAERLHLMPRLLGERQNEARYEAAHAAVSLSPATSWDWQYFGIQTRAGPSYEYVRTLRGLGPADDNYLVWQTKTDFLSHLYEHYLRDPRTGWIARLETDSRVSGVHSDITAHRVRASGQRLWNVGRYEPPLFVAGLRGQAATTFIDDDELGRLSPTYLNFLGGDADFRGAGRKQLPGDEIGFLSAAYAGLELRLGDWLPKRLQPFAFLDAAMGGRSEFELEPDVYYAPGAGLRWASPVGSMRLSLARGLTWRRGSTAAPPTPRWQFFFSFGREF